LAFVSAIGAVVGRKGALARLLAAPVLLALAFAPSSTESAIANGDTRSISLSNSHTNESGTFTYMVDGAYDSAVLEKLNWFLRDWRLNEPTKMDPKLFDIVWEVYRESGSSQPIDVLSGYRSPQTNAMLRRRSRQVAEHSQHMQGKAMDAHFIDVGTATIRDIAMRMQAGGVGFYPTGATPWIHIDSGSVRYWPRMSHDAMARLFPDGKTVFIPADGQPMSGYDQARAEIEARGGEVLMAHAGGGGLLGWLFGGARGGGADDEEESGDGELVVASHSGRSAGVSIRVASTSAPADSVAAAKRDLPNGETYAGPAEPAAASGEAEAQDEASPVTLHGPVAEQFIAPVPPRKPAEFAIAQLTEEITPIPPQRPAEFAFASMPAATAREDGGDRDLIAALLERGRLPGVITHGMRGAPPDVLALTEMSPPEPPERPAMLARAAALAAALPPLPPVRAGAHSAAKSAAVDAAAAQSSEISKAPARTAPAANPPAPAPPHSLALLSANERKAKAASPYGDLIYDAFKAGPESRTAQGFADLRGSSP
jgi:uncharacterized protein YcbK (DUF882 family)